MSAATKPSSYKTDDTALLREIVASAEVRLQAQLTASLAADQRALVLAGFFSATIAALVGGAAALLIGGSSQNFLGIVAMLAALGLFVSLCLTVYAARPVDWGYPATRPSAWMKDIATKKTESDRLGELAADAEKKAAGNAAIMMGNGRLVRAALIVAAATLGLSGLVITAHFLCVVANG